MSWQITVLATPTLFSLVVALFLCGYAVVQLKRGERDPAIVLFCAITVAAAVWIGFSALKLLQTNVETKLLFFRLLHVGAAALPPLLFLFVVAHTDRTHWLQPSLIGGVFALPTVFIGLLFLAPTELTIAGTEQITKGIVVVRVSSGPGFLLFSLYSLSLVVATLGLLFMETRRVGSAYYPQAALITLAVVTPMVFGLLTEAGVPPFTSERINLVPTSSAVSAVALGVLVVRYRLFDLPPLAYTTATRYAPDGLLVLDRNEHILHANERGQDLLDEQGIALGDDISDLLSGFEPERSADELVEITRADGTETYQRLLVEGLSRGGRRVGWVVVLRDETTQQRQQRQLAQFREAVEQSGHAVFIADSEGTVEYVNPSFEELTGYTEQEIIGQRLDRFHTGEGDTEAEHRWETIRAGERWKGEIADERADGERLVLSQTVSPLTNGDDEPQQFVVVAQDVTERDEYERRLERQRDNLEMLNQMVRHDIRNDLHRVLAYADVLKAEVDDEHTETVQQVLDAGEEAVALMKTAQDVTEVLLQPETDHTPVWLRHTLEDQVEEARASHEQTIITVDGELLAVQVWADEMLESVFRNLLNNAIVHNDKEIPAVTVSATATDEIVTVRIADNGPGIPDEMKDQIFEEGEKGIDSEGTGLGLYLVETLLDRYGGVVWIEDNDPEGSVFVVELPLEG